MTDRSDPALSRHRSRGLPPLKHRYRDFAALVFDPWVLVMSAATGALVYFSAKQSDPWVTGLFSVLAALSAGVLGARTTRLLSEVMEERALAARGDVAVRSLFSLLRRTGALSRRLGLFLERCDDLSPDESLDERVVVTNFEEVIESCGGLRSDIVSAVENWGDILPEARVSERLKEIEEYDTELRETKRERREIAIELAEEKVLAGDQRDRLVAQLAEKDANIAGLQRKISALGIDTRDLSRIASTSHVFEAFSAPSKRGRGIRQALADELETVAKRQRELAETPEEQESEEASAVTSDEILGDEPSED